MKGRPSILAEALLDMADAVAALPAAVAGYRESMVAAGFSVGAAEQMATEYHRVIVSLIFKGAGGG